MSKKEERSPYHPFTVEEVMAAEAGQYYIQIGVEIFSSENGKMAFSKPRAEELFETVMAGLLDMKKNGNEEEQEEAIKALLHFRIYPLRIH